MKQEELISKKELLMQTGISYGQLYRWKRQNLLPDTWFMKRASYTGQETFFPKQKMLARIQAILELKDAYSLEELAALFTPGSLKRTFGLLDVKDALRISSPVFELSVEIWSKRSFSFIELLLIELASELERAGALTQTETKGWLQTARRWSAELTGTDWQIVIYRKNEVLSFLLVDLPGRFQLDHDSFLVRTHDLSERAKDLNMRITMTMGE